MPIRHVVTWVLAGEDKAERQADAAQLARELEGLVGRVPSLLSLVAGANALAIEGNWDLVLIADFADEAGLREYQEHPAHQEVAAHVKALAVRRSAVDFEV